MVISWEYGKKFWFFLVKGCLTNVVKDAKHAVCDGLGVEHVWTRSVRIRYFLPIPAKQPSMLVRILRSIGFRIGRCSELVYDSIGRIQLPGSSIMDGSSFSRYVKSLAVPTINLARNANGLEIHGMGRSTRTRTTTRTKIGKKRDEELSWLLENHDP